MRDFQINQKREAPKKKIFRLWHFISLLTGLLIVGFRYFIHPHSPKVEYGYSRLIYPYISDILALVGRWIPPPYSASEVLIGGILAGMTVSVVSRLYFAVHEKSVLRMLFKTAFDGISLAILAYCFYLTAWGFNYLRQPFSVSLNPESSTAVIYAADYEKIGNDMAFLANKLYTENHESPYLTSLQRTDCYVNKALKKTIAVISPSRIPEPPATKVLLTEKLLSICGISGVFLPVFMESHINLELILWEKPFVVAHEKAHFMGFASETDANLIAYVTCLTSDCEALKYSAALRILITLHQYLPQEKWLKLINKALVPGVRQDIIRRNETIERLRKQYAWTFQFGEKINNAYLKLNSQKLGTGSYNAALPPLTIWWKGYMMRYR